MALDFSIFETEMAKLQSAFGRRVHSEAYDHWYEMAKHLTDYKFREVMAKLQFGDKFPSFKVFRDTEYNLSGNKTSDPYSEPTSKCRWCDGDGKLVINDEKGRAFLGRCMGCKLVTKSNRSMPKIVPENPPEGYVLDYSHTSKNDWWQRVMDQGGDPYDDDPVDAPQIPTVGNTIAGSDPDGHKKEYQRNANLRRDKERDMESWQDAY